DQAIESGAGHVGGAGGLPGTADLGGDLLLARLRGVQPASHQEQVLERRLAGPGTQHPVCLARLRLAAEQRLKNFAPAIQGRGAIERGVQDLNPIAGPEVENFRGAQAGAQAGQAGAYLRPGKREPGYVIYARMAIGEAHDPDLVHGQSRPRGALASVTERSERAKMAVSGSRRL